MRKFVCDNCGNEVNEAEVAQLWWGKNVGGRGYRVEFDQPIGDYCQKCQQKIEAQIKEGIQ